MDACWMCCQKGGGKKQEALNGESWKCACDQGKDVVVGATCMEGDGIGGEY